MRSYFLRKSGIALPESCKEVRILAFKLCPILVQSLRIAGAWEILFNAQEKDFLFLAALSFRLDPIHDCFFQ